MKDALIDLILSAVVFGLFGGCAILYSFATLPSAEIRNHENENLTAIVSFED